MEETDKTGPTIVVLEREKSLGAQLCGSFPQLLEAILRPHGTVETHALDANRGVDREGDPDIERQLESLFALEAWSPWRKHASLTWHGRKVFFSLPSMQLRSPRSFLGDQGDRLPPCILFLSLPHPDFRYLILPHSAC